MSVECPHCGHTFDEADDEPETFLGVERDDAAELKQQLGDYRRAQGQESSLGDAQ